MGEDGATIKPNGSFPFSLGDFSFGTTPGLSPTPTMPSFPTTPAALPTDSAADEDSFSATGTAEEKLRALQAQVKRQQATIDRQQDELEARKAGSYRGELTTVRALQEGVPDSVRTGVDLPKPAAPLDAIEVGRNFSEDRLAPLDAEIQDEYCYTSGPKKGQVKIEEFRQSAEAAETKVATTRTQLQHDELLRNPELATKYSEMSEEEQEALLTDLRSRNGGALADALAGEESEMVQSARKEYFYAQASASDNSYVRAVYTQTAAEHYAKLHGKDDQAGVPFDVSTITALRAKETQEATALATALENPVNEAAIASAMADYIDADPGVIAAKAALPDDSHIPEYAVKKADLEAAQQAAIANAKRDSATAAIFNSDPTTIYNGIRGTAAVSGVEYPTEFYEKLREEGTPEARALAVALERHESEEEIQAAMDAYAYSLGTTRADVQSAKEEARTAKEKLKYAERLPQYLDRALDGRNQRLLSDMGLESLQFTKGEKALGFFNRGVVKPLRGMGVFVKSGLDLLSLMSQSKSAWDNLFGAKKPENFIDKANVESGAEAFKGSDAGSSVADKVKTKGEAKLPEGSKAYEDAVAANDKHKKAMEDMRKTFDEDRSERTVTRHKALEGYKTTV